jgi:hypothetical protein
MVRAPVATEVASYLLVGAARRFLGLQSKIRLAGEMNSLPRQAFPKRCRG